MAQKIGAGELTPRFTHARMDMLSIFILGSLVWLVIDRTETCHRLFDWIVGSPHHQADSAILAFMLASIGITIYAIRRYRDMLAAMLERQAAEERAHALAFHDPLTGLPNRRALNEQLETIVAGRSPAGEIGLLIIDLDRFKDVNDVYGHLAGDCLLREVGKRLEKLLDKGQTVFRLGGDEFAMICEIDGDHDAPRRAAGRVVNAVAAPFAIDRLVHHIGASVGIAMFPGDAQDCETLMRRADIALYRAKEGGRGQHRSFESAMDAEITHRAAMEQELRTAIRHKALRPFYQPLVDLSSGAIVGFELLARWPRPAAEAVEPETFVAIAEESGLINDMMMQLLERACEEARGWDPELTIALNISPIQLKDPWLSQKVLATLTRCGLPARRLAIEITETALIADAANASRTVESFRNQGMTICLDDFGTGYSSLHHLRLLRFDKIKIDRSFVQAIGTDPEATRIVRAITNLASSLDLPVIAEGVESSEVAEQLRAMGCAQAQGYHFGRPMPGSAVARMLSPLGRAA